MKKIFLVILGISLLGEISNCQNLIRVNNNPGIDADYTNLQDANDNANDGDTIYLESSETGYPYAEITKSITIIGPGYFLNENPETQANALEARLDGIIFNTGSAGSIITGCNTGSYHAYIKENNISIIRCAVNNIYLSGVIENILILQNYISGGILESGGGNVITNSLISNNIIQQLIDINSLNSSVQIVNNVFKDYGSSKPTIYCFNSLIQNNISADIDSPLDEGNRGNTVMNNILAIDGINANGNQYNIDMTNVFADFDGTLGYSADGKWQLKAGSPAIGAGTGDVDCGVFGGVNPYVLSGLPDLPHIYEAIIPATANSGDGLSVTIKVKAGQ
jgi:hypothetical protein